MDIKSGNRFGRLLATEALGWKNNHRVWKCKCDCGRECEARQDKLLAGRTRSCGCLHSEITLGGSEVATERELIAKLLRELKSNLLIAERLATKRILERIENCQLDEGADYRNFELTGSPQFIAERLAQWASLVRDLLSVGNPDDSIKIKVELSKVN